METVKTRTLPTRILSGLGAAAVVLAVSSCSGTSVPGTASVTSAMTTPPTTSPTESSPAPGTLQIDDLTYRYESGSVPPPWNHYWEFELIGTTGTLHWQAVYGNDDKFVEDRTFELTAQAAADYRAQVASVIDGYVMLPGEARSVGGATAVLTWTDSTGGSGTISDIGALESTEPMSKPLNEAAESAVPADIFAEVSAAYDAWTAEHD